MVLLTETESKLGHFTSTIKKKRSLLVLLQLLKSNLNLKQLLPFKTYDELNSKEIFYKIEEIDLGISGELLIILCMVPFRKYNQLNTLIFKLIEVLVPTPF